MRESKLQIDSASPMRKRSLARRSLTRVAATIGALSAVTLLAAPWAPAGASDPTVVRFGSGDMDHDGLPDADECAEATNASVLTNGGFEAPPLGGPGMAFVPAADMAPWHTSDTAFELWGNGFLGVPSAEGDQFAELNANIASRIYQDVATEPGAVYQWSVLHRGRDGVDVMAVLIGDAAQPLTRTAVHSADKGEWTGFGDFYQVPAGQTMTRFAYEAVTTASGSAGSGNLIDGISFRKCPDSDGDGLADPADSDSDNDGIADGDEGPATTDTDGDGTPDRLDADADGDGLIDKDEGTDDTDGDGIPNFRDSDSDGDGLSDEYEGTVDTDGDGLADFLDTDSDGDGILDKTEGTDDPDGDGKPNFRDLNSDADLIPDKVEGSDDTDGDETPNYLDTDSDGDGIPDAVETTADADLDGIPNYLDTDANGDGIPDSQQGMAFLVKDSDGDGVPDFVEGQEDPDGDGIPAYLDTDSDNDGVPDSVEGTKDSDGDGIIDSLDAVNGPNTTAPTTTTTTAPGATTTTAPSTTTTTSPTDTVTTTTIPGTTTVPGDEGAVSGVRFSPNQLASTDRQLAIGGRTIRGAIVIASALLLTGVGLEWLSRRGQKPE